MGTSVGRSNIGWVAMNLCRNVLVLSLAPRAGQSSCVGTKVCPVICGFPSISRNDLGGSPDLSSGAFVS